MEKIDLLFVQTITSIVCDKRGRYSTAHVYKHAIRSFRSFVGPNPLPLVG